MPKHNGKGVTKATIYALLRFTQMADGRSERWEVCLAKAGSFYDAWKCQPRPRGVRNCYWDSVITQIKQISYWGRSVLQYLRLDLHGLDVKWWLSWIKSVDRRLEAIVHLEHAMCYTQGNASDVYYSWSSVITRFYGTDFTAWANSEGCFGRETIAWRRQKDWRVEWLCLNWYQRILKYLGSLWNGLIWTKQQQRWAGEDGDLNIRWAYFRIRLLPF